MAEILGIKRAEATEVCVFLIIAVRRSDKSCNLCSTNASATVFGDINNVSNTVTRTSRSDCDCSDVTRNVSCRRTSRIAASGTAIPEASVVSNGVDVEKVLRVAIPPVS